MTRARRSQGEGAVFQLPDGRWRGVADLGWVDGRRSRKYLTRRTEGEVIKDLRKLIGDLESGRVLPGRSPTLSEWLDRYLSEVAASSVRPSTLHRYRQEVRLYIAPALGRVRLDKLQPAQISAFYRARLAHLSPGSVRRLHALLRRSLSVAVRWGVLAVNPVLAVDPPSIEVKEVEPLSVEEARRFLGVVRGHRFEARWMLAVMLGLRQGEALGVSWRDVDLESGSLVVRRALQYRPGDGLHLVAPKTARSRRTVPLPEVVVAALRVRQQAQAAEQRMAGEFWEDWGLVFSTAVGTPLSPRNDYRDFRRLLELAGVRQVRLHDLRHTAASLMLLQGVNPRVVMEVLGHSQISITMNTYSHVAPAATRAAVSDVAGIFDV